MAILKDWKKNMQRIPQENRKAEKPRRIWIQVMRRSMSEQHLDDEGCTNRRP